MPEVKGGRDARDAARAQLICGVKRDPFRSLERRSSIQAAPNRSGTRRMRSKYGVDRKLELGKNGVLI